MVKHLRWLGLLSCAVCSCTLKPAVFEASDTGGETSVVDVARVDIPMGTDVVDVAMDPDAMDAPVVDSLDAPTVADASDATDVVDATDVIDADAGGRTDTGVDVPVDLGAADTGVPAPPVQIAGGQNGPGAVVADGPNVYWMTCSGSLMTVSIASPFVPTLLATMFGCGADVAAAGNGKVYIASPTMGTINEVYDDGSMERLVAMSQRTPTGIAANPTAVFWTNQASGEIMQAGLPTGSATQFATTQNSPTDIALDAQNAYWTNGGPSGAVMRQALIAGSPQVLAVSQPNPSDIAVYGAFVYWVVDTGSTFEIRRARTDSASSPGILVASIAKAGSQPSLTIAVDGRGVFAANSGDLSGNGTIALYGLMGGLIQTLDVTQATPRGIARDATHVFWTNGGDGTVNAQIR